MKKIKNISFFLLLTLSIASVVFISCQNEDNNNEEELSQLEKDALIINELLEEYKPSLVSKSSKMADDKIITFEVVKNLRTNEISIQNEKEVSFFPMAERSAYYNRISESYQVDCSGGSNGDWSESCDGKWSCGKLIASCLDEGGCATVCQQDNSFTQERVSSNERLYSSVKVTFLPVR